MKVVCIKEFKSTNLMYELTYGKIYDTISITRGLSNYIKDEYKITCDRGFVEFYNKDLFVTLEEWRERQLDKILI